MNTLTNQWLPVASIAVVLAALAMVFVSYRLHIRQHSLAAALVVAAAALLLRGFSATDLALHPWDERYHALVAKHLIQQPLVPTLYADSALPYDYTNWYSNHVWLHKPPLALWCQAASMWAFGVAEFPMRLPSVLFATAAVLVTFAIGTLLFSRSVGLVAAVFHAFNGFVIDLASGRRASDHVDTLLVFLVAAGVLGALIAERNLPRLTSIILGVACGLAYLTKSLPGLLLLPIWLLISSQMSPGRRNIRTLIISVGVALLIALPWTIYAWSVFPLEAQYESRYAWRHVFDVLEGHGGPPWRYVADVPRYFGELVYIPFAIAIVAVVGRTATPALRAMLLWVALPYVLFSTMATKMPAYITLAAPAMFLVQADCWLAIHRRWHREEKPWRKISIAVALVVLAVSPARQLLSPTGPLERRDRDPQWTRDLRDLNRMIGNQKAVIFQVPTPIEAMFYTPYVAYEYSPTDSQFESLRERGYAVYIYEHRTPIAGPTVKRINHVGEIITSNGRAPRVDDAVNMGR